MRRSVAAALLAVGVLLVFAGLNAALGPSILGVVSSLAVIAALLYAGAVWFGAPPAPAMVPAPPLVVFDHERRIVSGGAVGQPLAVQFPEILRPEIERRCAAALAGTSGRFHCLHNGRLVLFDALPVRAADGTIRYGILLTTAAESEVAATA
jgi:hypothetical protein